MYVNLIEEKMLCKQTCTEEKSIFRGCFLIVGAPNSEKVTKRVDIFFHTGLYMGMKKIQNFMLIEKLILSVVTKCTQNVSAEKMFSEKITFTKILYFLAITF
jgi:hypothetical protein